MRKRYILTGAPGAGKTSILQALKSAGFDTVNEAATDIIARKQAAGVEKPWEDPDFILDIIQLQKQRLEDGKTSPHSWQFHDRSIIDAYVLGKFLGHPTSDLIEALVKAVVDDGIYQKNVFFIESLGFIERTEARRISLADAIAFGKLHQEVYEGLGFHCIRIPALSIKERTDAILGFVSRGFLEFR